MNNEKYGCESYDNSVPDSWVMQVTSELSEKVQKILFEQGVRWLDTADVVLKATWLYLSPRGTLTYSAEVEKLDCDKEEISAYAFVASNGRCKWLPSPGEKCLVRDLECESWREASFSFYRFQHSSLPISTSKGSFKQVKPYEKPKLCVDFAKFLQEHSALEKFKENCKPENQRWAHVPNYYTNLSDLGGMQPKQYLSNAFSWGRSPLFTHTGLHSLERAWFSILEAAAADEVTFDKNNLFQEC